MNKQEQLNEQLGTAQLNKDNSEAITAGIQQQAMYLQY